MRAKEAKGEKEVMRKSSSFPAMPVRQMRPAAPVISSRVGDVILDSIADGVFTVDNGWTIRSFNKIDLLWFFPA
jgi:hypothetical protein